MGLAGAELVDLIGAGAAALDGDRIVPGPPSASSGDPAAALVKVQPYETVEDWLWRRGRGLAETYAAAREPEPVHRRGLRRSSAPEAASPGALARRHAVERWESGDPLLQGLAAATGVRSIPPGTAEQPLDDAAGTVVAAVDDAVAELAAVRHRRGIEQAAFDNIWRAP